MCTHNPDNVGSTWPGFGYKTPATLAGLIAACRRGLPLIVSDCAWFARNFRGMTKQIGIRST